MAETKTAIGVVIPPGVVAVLVASVLSGIVAIGGYMVVWNREDLAFKREILARLVNVERVVEAGVLPRAEERINNIDRRLSEHIRWAEAQELDLDHRLNEVERRKRDRDE